MPYRPLFRRTAALALSATLAACGGGSETVAETEADSRPPPAPTTETEGPAPGPAGPDLPQPWSTGLQPWETYRMAVALAKPPALGFYDLDAGGQPRVLRNDLDTGPLAAEVQLVQSHSMAPRDNAAREMPTPVALREALLLVMGTGALETADIASSRLTVTATRRGLTLGRLQLKPPLLLPASDNRATGRYGRPEVRYSRRAWSAVLPWQWMRPGLQLAFSFESAQGRTLTGLIADRHIEFAAPAELVTQNIRLGLMTPVKKDTGYLMDQPETAGTDYFQTLPVARLTVAQYEDMQLDEVMVATGGGTIYRGPSPQTGTVYTGDMRQDVAKVQVAQGINLANSGVVDSPLDENQPERFNHHTVVHSRGLYANGVVEHGLSGGNGMVNLLDSTGNEFSHEMGHSFGLGHYPGAQQDARHPVHHADSGWGYLPARHAMRGNLWWSRPFDAGGSLDYRGNFAGLFNYNHDAMSSGAPDSSFSRFTHHTGYSARRIQDYLNTARSGGPRAVPDLGFPSGWRGWNPVSGEWVDRSELAPAFAAPRPVAVGVPVVTLLGAYHTGVRRLNLLYPAFHGNWGVVYDHPAPPATGAACWLEVVGSHGRSRQIGLHTNSLLEAPRKLHINIDARFEPQSSSLMCRDDRDAVITVYHRSLAGPAGPARSAVVIGQEQGLTALRRVELGELEAVLRLLPPAGGLGDRHAAMLLAMRDEIGGLPEPARSRAGEWLEAAGRADLLNADVLENPALQRPGAPAHQVSRLRRDAALLRITGQDGSWQPAAAPLALSNGSCMALAEWQETSARLVLSPKASCQQQDHQTWWMDAASRIHNQARPDLCLMTDGGWITPITVGPCQSDDQGQAFVQRPSGRLESLHFANRSITAHGDLVILNNVEAENKKFSRLPQNPQAAWPLLMPQSLKALWQQLR